MKKALVVLLLVILSTQLIVCSEFYDFEYIQSKITWENGKKIIKDNPGKVLALLGALGGLICARYFYLQNRMILQEVVDLRSTTQALQEGINAYALFKNNTEMHEQVDQLHYILTAEKDVIPAIEKFLEHNEAITVNAVALNKIHICWNNKEDYGKPALNRLEVLLWLCKEKYFYPPEIEVHKINRQLECILLPHY